MASQGRFYTTAEAAAMIGVSDSRLRQLVLSGEAVPDQRIGHLHVFTLAEIERLRNRPRAKGGRGKKRPTNAASV